MTDASTPSAPEPPPFLIALGEKLGLPSLDFNAHGVCRLVLNDERLIDINWDAERQRVVLYGEVGELDQKDFGKWLPILMQANISPEANGDGWLALDEASGNTVLLCALVYGESLEPEGFLKRFVSFLDVMDPWAERLRREPARAPEAEDTLVSEHGSEVEVDLDDRA